MREHENPIKHFPADRATINGEIITNEVNLFPSGQFDYQVKHGDKIVARKSGFKNEMSAYYASKDFWRTYVRTLVRRYLDDEHQNDSDIDKAKKAGRWVAVLYSAVTGITYALTAIISEVPPGYRYELVENKREIEVGVDRSDLTETVREACERWVEVFNKKLADW
jgi:hypothetical protein